MARAGRITAYAAQDLRADAIRVRSDPMWAIWVSAYIMGFSGGSNWFCALAHPTGYGLSTIADQEIAAALLWAIPGLFFAPVIFASWIRWLRESGDPDEELRGIPDGHMAAMPPRPPRGWRAPSR